MYNNHSPSLTDREIEILEHLAKGHTLAIIAEQLHLSLETIRSHKKNIYRKLDINNGIQLGMWIERNLIVNQLKIA